MAKSQGPRPIPLLNWIWRSYVRSALIPLLCIELALLGIYLASHTMSERRTIDTVRAISEAEFRNTAAQKAAVVSERLAGIATSVAVFRRHAREALTTPCTPEDTELARYAWSEEGVFHTAERGGAALYYSARTNIGPEQQMRAYCSARLDDLMISLTEASPLVEQIYLNTHDSMNRIFPWFNVTEQYVPDMDIPSFNFYYEADAAHNPDRTVEWTDAYLDPAGQGWMVSAIAPVYRGDFLEGVVGIDVTLGTVLNRVLQLDLPDGSYAMLVGRDGRILAMPRAAARDLRVEAPVTAGDYGPVHSETLQPDDLNLFARTGMAGLAQAVRAGHGGLAHIELADGRRTAAWSMIDATGWTMLVMADESQVFSAVIAVGETFHTIGWAMLVVLGLFSALFFLLLYLRAQRHSRAIAGPLLGLRDMVRRIGEGDFRQTPVTSGIAELNGTAEEVARVGAALGEANQRLVDADRELRRALMEAQAANRAKTEFLAKMSHELRTPLNAIIGFADLLADRSACPGPAEQQADFAEEIRCSGRHLLGLINDVLALSKIEAGQRKLAPAPIPVAGLFAEMRRATAAEADARGLAIETEIPPSLPALVADPQAARQVLQKLLSNAVKFTPSGGRVTLGASAEGGGRLALWVADTGIGIPDDRLRDVLEPFQQVEGAYARGYGGTGLGLTIVRDLVELHGGEVRIASRMGEGTRVTVRFPLPENHQAAGAPAAEPAVCV